jgi:hypothetical protein
MKRAKPTYLIKYVSSIGSGHNYIEGNIKTRIVLGSKV